MCATEVGMPCEMFNFSGQSRRDTHTIEIEEMRSYDDIMVDRTRRWFGAVCRLSNDFSC